MNAATSNAGTRSSLSGPVKVSDRIIALDVIRGIALLGILMINIEIFSNSEQFMTNPTLGGDFEGSNRVIWLVKQYLFSGKMWSLFSMLFGAGAYLLITRAEEKGRAAGIADIYYRRLIFLLLFGLIHAYLIWSGDILYLYALVGLFLYPLRKIPFRWMIGLILTLFVLNLSQYLVAYRNDIVLQSEVLEIEAIMENGKEPTEDQQTKLDQWKEKVTANHPDPETIQENIEAMGKGTYLKVRKEEAKWVYYFHTELIYNRIFLMTLIMMLLGMALIKSGVLSASLSKSFYLRMFLICFPAGCIVVYFNSRQIIDHGFDPISSDLDRILHYLERILISLGYVGGICLFVKSRALGWLKRSLAAVGRMAFSNYILQSLICSMIFFGYGWGMYAKLDLTHQLWVVGAIWLFQLIASPIWLKYFRFGPLEWVWRSLTYLKRQPFRI